MLSGFGQITAGATARQAGNPAEILFPPALLRRAARYVSGAADLAATAATSRTGFPRRHATSWPRLCAETLTD